MKIADYIKREFDAGKHPDIAIKLIAGDYCLVDKDDKILDTPSFKTRDAAENYRTKSLDRQRRKIRFL